VGRQEDEKVTVTPEVGVFLPPQSIRELGNTFENESINKKKMLGGGLES
jgi:hypothetical protein